MNWMTSLVVLIFVALSWSCDKKHVYEYLLPPEVKEYMFFKAGTYWQYKDTATGDIRSVHVLSDTSYMYEEVLHSGEVIGKREAFKWTTSKTEFTGRAMAPWNGNSGKDSIIRASVSESLRGFNEGHTDVFFYPFILNKSLQAHGSTTVTLIDKIDTLVIFGKTYYDVVKFHDESNFTEDQRETVTFVARNYGIVRKDILIEQQNSTKNYWQRYMLQDSHIKQ